MLLQTRVWQHIYRSFLVIRIIFRLTEVYLGMMLIFIPALGTNVNIKKASVFRKHPSTLNAGYLILN